MNNYVNLINNMIKIGIEDIPNFEENEVSDGYHTFNELYEFRKLYNALLFNEWAKSNKPKYDVHKSKKHYNDEKCFDGKFFIVVAMLPDGQISNHYKLEDWDLFKIPEFEKAKYKYDDHTAKDVIKRLTNVIKNETKS